MRAAARVAAAPGLVERAILDHSPDLVAVVDRRGAVVEASASLVELVGAAAAGPGRLVCGFLHPQESMGLRRTHARVLAGQPTDADRTGLTHRLRAADGRWRWVETKGRVSLSDAADPLVVYIGRDVTERLALEQRLDDMREGWPTVFDHLREGVVVIDRQGVVVSANPAAAEFLRVPLGQLIGSLGRDQVVVIDETGHPMAAERLPSTRSFATGRTQEEALAYRRRDGTVVWLHARVVPFVPSGSTSPTQVAILLENATGPFAPEQDVGAGGGILAEAVRSLTPRERQVLLLLADGLDVRSVARELGITVHTARTHIKSIMRKLDARTQLQAVLIAARSGVLATAAAPAHLRESP